MVDTTPALERVLEKLAALERADPTRRLFGSEAHDYRLVSPVSETELSAMEAGQDVRLPTAYRAFVRAAGNGGAGPGYGLQRFGHLERPEEAPTAASYGKLETISSHPPMTIQRRIPYDASGNRLDAHDLAFWNGLKRAAQDPGVMARPFPFSRPIPWDSPADWWPEEDGGRLLLAEYGCGLEAWLVLDGARRGEVWGASEDSFEPFGSLLSLHDPDGIDESTTDDPLDFLQWYEHWLDLYTTAAHRGTPVG